MGLPPTSSAFFSYPDLANSGSTGDQQASQGNGAVQNIPGTANGASPAGFTAGALAVYPRFDGVSNLLPGLPGDTSTFTQWHSAHQLEYLLTPANNNRFEVVNAGITVAYYTAVGGEVLDLASLGLADYSKLSRDQQEQIHATMGDTAFRSSFYARLGLTLNSTAVLDGVLAALSDKITTMPTATEVRSNLSAGLAATINQKRDEIIDVFSRQLDHLRAGADENYALALDQVKTVADEIEARLDRIVEYYKALAYPPRQRTTPSQLNVSGGYLRLGYGAGMDINVRSLDSDETVRRGLDSFLRSERDVVSALDRRAAMASGGLLRDPKLDVATLIYMLQLSYQAENKAIEASGTEELRQLQKLLSDYGVMQRLIRETLQEFNPAEQEEKHRFMGLGSRTFGMYGSFFDDSNNADSSRDFQGAGWSVFEASEIERRAYSMFTNYTQHFDEPKSDPQTGRGHPQEILANVLRPTLDLTDGNGSLKEHFRTTFEQMGTNLADAVTLLNQQNQIKQSDIENSAKAANRHFELGNNALRKMNDLLLSIGRG